MADSFKDSKFQRSNTDATCSTTSVDSYDYSRTTSDLSSYSDANETNSSSSEHSPVCCPDQVRKKMSRLSAISQRSRRSYNYKLDTRSDDEEAEAELEMMKEKFSKLLLGEDMSGGGKGVCTAVAISNAITNLYATLFGQFKRLESLSAEKKSMWRREMDCLLSVCDYIVEYSTSPQSLPDGTTVEMLTSRQRADIGMNLPALQKLDAMLLDIFSNFEEAEFWYMGEENSSPKDGTIGSFRRADPRGDEKWWLPVPCIPTEGLSDRSRKLLQQKRKCADQIHKAARAINTSILSDMQVPESYVATLPKSARASIGDAVYKTMSTSDPFSPDHLLNHLDIKSEHEALDVADKVETSMYVWRRKSGIYNNTKPKWETVSDMLASGDKNVTLATRAESLLLTLKQRYPELSQTTLDTSKIQYNKDVGQAILESYSRVLEGLAFNIVARINDVLHIDGSVKKIDS